MIEQLFGSKTRTQLLRTFLHNPDRPFYVRELTRLLDVQINSVRHELQKLEKLGILAVVKVPGVRSAQKKYYQLNSNSVLCPELKALFLKSRVLVEKDFVNKLKNIGKLSYFALTGIFTGRDDSPTDVLIVGKIDRKKFSALVKKFEVDFGHEINFTIMDDEEMRYRMDVMDRFLYNVLEEPKLVFVDKYFVTDKVKM